MTHGKERLQEFLFGSGWGFLVPYFALYCAAVALDLRVAPVTSAFAALHVVTLLGLGAWLVRARHRFSRSDWWFWGLLFVAFLAPGAYLEYPTDPWEHVLRTFSWSTKWRFSESDVRSRFGYFWMWTTVFWVPVAWRRLALGVLAALTQWLVALQIAGLSSRLGFTKRWTYVQVVAFVVLFGTNLFSYRYYALASTPFAYVAYLQALSLLADGTAGRGRRWWELLPLVALIEGNHPQELFLLVIAAIGVLWVRGYERVAPERRRRYLAATALFFLASLAFGIGLRYRFPAAYARLGLGNFTPVGTLRIWKRSLRFTDTLGVHGLAAIAGALFLFGRRRLLSVLTILPVAAVSFPPLVFVTLYRQRVDDAADFYRLLYLFPTSFALVAALEEWLPRLVRAERETARAALAALGVVVLLALPPRFPWRGRLFFQFHSPPPSRSLVALDETAAWLAAHRLFPPDCYVLTDDATSFVLSAQLGWTLPRSRVKYNLRLDPMLRAQQFEGLEYDDFRKFLRPYRVCAVLLPLVGRIPAPDESRVASLSGHWAPHYGDIRWLTGRNLPYLTKALLDHGWHVTPVPPFYDLYEPSGAALPYDAADPAAD